MKHLVYILVFLSIIAGISMAQEAVCNCVKAPCDCSPQPPQCNCPLLTADLDVSKLPLGPAPCFCPIGPEPVNSNLCTLCKCALPEGDPSTFVQGPAPCFCPQLPPPLKCGQPGIACSCLEIPAGVDVNTLKKGPPPCCCLFDPNATP